MPKTHISLVRTERVHWPTSAGIVVVNHDRKDYADNAIEGEMIYHDAYSKCERN